jgi:hypothetical protein
MSNHPATLREHFFRIFHPALKPHPRRYTYLQAWRRAIAVEHGLWLRNASQERNWQAYIAAEMRTRA